MNVLDYLIIVAYFVLVIGLGFWYRKRASENLHSYFLGDNKIHWLVLAMSGSVSTFDITGTMWIVSLLFVIGMKSMWVHWMWGFMLGAFCLSFMGKWVRRSNAMTGAEWMVTRFGNTAAGAAARTAYALMAVITQAAFIGYAFQGIGKFSSVYLSLPPNLCAVIIIGITTLYVLLGGLFSVVITDVIQTVILTMAGIVIASLAYSHVNPEHLAQLLPTDWNSIAPVWRIEYVQETASAEYEWFGLLLIAWVAKGLFLNAGGPAQMYDFQRFLSARNERDAAMIGASWSFFLVIRWAMAMGITLLAFQIAEDIRDPEQVMPIVLQEYLPVGLKGIVIAGLLAAFMSTFSSTANSAASYIVRDFWQPFFKPDADDRSLIRASYVATAAVVVAGILIGVQAGSITQIFNWLMMALGAAVVVPNVLRWYWWRLNGWGYAIGSLAGIALSLIPLFLPDTPMYVSFPVISLGSFVVCLLASYVTDPVEQNTLIAFYQKVRPFGLWAPVSRLLKSEQETSSNDAYESPYYALFNTCVGMIAIAGLYLAPMYLVGHWHGRALMYFAVASAAVGVLYFTWYRYLPQDD